MSCSPRSITRSGSLSGAGSSELKTAGTQYSRIRLPMSVPRPTRHRAWFSSRVSIAEVLLLFARLQGLLELGADLVTALAAPILHQLVVTGHVTSTENNRQQTVGHGLVEAGRALGIGL